MSSCRKQETNEAKRDKSEKKRKGNIWGAISPKILWKSVLGIHFLNVIKLFNEKAF